MATHHKPPRTAGAYLLLINLILSQSAAADLADARFEIWLGIFRSEHDSQIRVDSKDFGLGTEIDFEDDLGLEDQLTRVVRGGFAWRFASRHTLSVEYYRFSRDSSSTVRADLRWEAIEVEAGANVESRLDIDIFETHYEYSLVLLPKHELQAQAGIFWTSIEAELVASGEGKVSVEGVPIAGGASAASKANSLAPLPVLGVNYRWQFVRNWYAAAGVDWFGISLGEISGSLINWDLGIVYQTPWPLVLGMNYTSYNFDLELDSDEWLGALQWEFRGPQLFLGARF